MTLNAADVFVIIRWPADAGQPRYSFATVPHANELDDHVERVQTCSTIEQAVSIVTRLNEQEQEQAA